jgi:hypothetical protein
MCQASLPESVFAIGWQAFAQFCRALSRARKAYDPSTRRKDRLAAGSLEIPFKYTSGSPSSTCQFRNEPS